MARDSLLEQQLGRLHAWIGVKALHHRVVEQHIRQGDQRHPGVVGQVGADDSPSRRSSRAGQWIVIGLAIPRFAAGQAKDAATALPVYLRDKVAKTTSERA